MIRTGKSGRYRYYACSGYRLKGLRACGKPMANVSPTSLIGATWLDRSLDPNNVNYDAFAAKQMKESESKIGRLYAAVENGTLTDTTLLRSRLDGLEKQRDETLRLLAMLDRELPALRQALSNAQARQIAGHLKGRLLDAPKPL